MKYYEIINVLDLDGEVWKTHPVFTEYEASNYGRIRAKERYTQSNWSRKNNDRRLITRKWKAKIVKQHNAFEYLAAQIRCKPYFSHIFICECWYGLANKPNMEVHHINENKYDNRPVNIMWVTRKQNKEANGLLERVKKKKWIKRGSPFYVYCDKHKIYKITETLEDMGKYLNVTATTVCDRIKRKWISDTGHTIIKKYLRNKK